MNMRGKSIQEQTDPVDPDDIVDLSQTIMEGSFLPLISVLASNKQKSKFLTNQVIERKTGQSALLIAAYYGKIKPLKTLIE